MKATSTKNLFNAPKGTTFEKTKNKTVVITRADQPICEIPISDLKNFFKEQ